MLRKLLGRRHPESASGTPEPTCSDADPARRAAAVRQLSDPATLLRMQSEDPDHRVRASASDRLRSLLIGGNDCLSLEQRLGILQASDDNTLLAHVARRAREADIRLAAVSRVSGQRLLAEVVMEDASHRVRMSALERLTDTDLLSYLDQRFRRRDARLARHARQRYQRLMVDPQQAQRMQSDAEALCDELEQTIARPGTRLGACLNRLGNRRARLGKGMPPAQAERFDQLMQAGRRIQVKASRSTDDRDRTC